MTSTSNLRVVLVLFSLAACSSGEKKTADSGIASGNAVAASVDITSPGDGDVPADGAPLPQPPVVYHLGNGASDKVIDSLPPGPHRVIAVFASGDHVAMPNVKRDTVTFIVK